MKTFSFLLGVTLLVGNAIAQAPAVFTIQNDTETAQKITLHKFDYTSQNMRVLYTSEIGSGDLSMVVEDALIEPSIYLLTSDQGINLRLAVENPGKVHIELSDQVMIESRVAQPSNFPDVIQNLNQQFFSELITRYDQAIQDKNQAEIASLEQEKTRLLKTFTQAMEEKVREMGISSLAYDALPYFDIHKNYEFLQEMNEKFQQEFPGSGMSESLQKRMEQAALIAIGSKAPDFAAIGMDGKKISLKDFDGTYLLIDFWASWCRACRVENPEFVDLHGIYKSQGFDIISISIDEDVNKWKEAS